MPEITAITGRPAFLWYLAANFLSVVVASGIWFGVPPENGGVWGGFVALVSIALVCLAVTCYILWKKAKEDDATHSFKEMLGAVTFKNMMLMKERLQPHIRFVPWVWCFLIKYFIPHILIVLFVNLAASETDQGEPVFSGYGGYSTTPYQVLGILLFVFVTVLFLVGFAFPNLYKFLDLTNREVVVEDDKLLDPTVRAATNGGEDEESNDKSDEEELATSSKAADSFDEAGTPSEDDAAAAEETDVKP